MTRENRHGPPLGFLIFLAFPSIPIALTMSACRLSNALSSFLSLIMDSGGWRRCSPANLDLLFIIFSSIRWKLCLKHNMHDQICDHYLEYTAECLIYMVGVKTIIILYIAQVLMLPYCLSETMAQTKSSTPAEMLTLAIFACTYKLWKTRNKNPK